MSKENKDRMQEINNEYAKECAEIGDFIVKSMFNNEHIVAKYNKIKRLQKEAKLLGEESGPKEVE